MTRAARMTMAAVLAVVAIALLAIGAFLMQSRINALEADVASAEAKVFDLQSQIQSQKGAFFFEALSVEFEENLNAVVAEPNPAERQRLVSQIDIPLSGLPVEYGAAIEVFVRLDFLAQAPSEPERQQIKDDLIQKLIDMSPEIEEQPFVTKEQASVFSLLVTAFGGLVSAGSSLFFFVTGGGRREIEDEMLELDLEMKRVQLAKLRFDAKDALDANART